MGLFDGRAQVNAAVFYYDYKDMQLKFLKDLATLLAHADGQIRGIDLEIRAKPMAGLDLGAWLSLLDGTVRDIGFATPSGAATHDRDVPNMPKYRGNLMARYSWPSFDGTLSLEADVQFQDDMFFEIQNEPSSLSKSHEVGNMRLAWSKPDLQVSGFVKNIWEEQYALYIANNNDFGGYKNVLPSRPRWWGLEFSYRFGE